MCRKPRKNKVPNATLPGTGVPGVDPHHSLRDQVPVTNNNILGRRMYPKETEAARPGTI